MEIRTYGDIFSVHIGNLPLELFPLSHSPRRVQGKDLGEFYDPCG
jgi:hypothetical protein